MTDLRALEQQQARALAATRKKLRADKPARVIAKNQKPTRGRVIDRSHKGAVAKLFCIATFVRTGQEAYGVQVCHIRYSDPRWGGNPGLQRKPDDWRVTPLLPAVHHEQHAFGDEREWWRGVGIYPYALANDLKASSPDHENMLTVLRAHGNRARQRRAA